MKRYNLYRGGMHENPAGRWVEYMDVVEQRFGIAPDIPDPRVAALEAAAVLLAIPYEGLLADGESRRWIAPALWTAIEEGIKATRSALAAMEKGESRV